MNIAMYFWTRTFWRSWLVTRVPCGLVAMGIIIVVVASAMLWGCPVKEAGRMRCLSGVSLIGIIGLAPVFIGGVEVLMQVIMTRRR